MTSIPSEQFDNSSAATKEKITPTKSSLAEENNTDMKDTAENQDSDEQYVKGFKLYTVLLSLTLVAFLFMLDQTIVVPAIPKISVQFNSIKDIGKRSFKFCYFQ